MENDMREDFYKESKIIKLLFLGAAESGKTTILKQMKLLHPMQNRWAVQQLHSQHNADKETVVTRGGLLADVFG